MRILVHVHVFYKEIWPEIRDLLKNLDGFDWDLYITTVHDDFEPNSDIIALARHADVHVVENKGYDVGPFIWVINNVDIERYDYIVKLHTKRDVSYKTIPGNYLLGGKRWRKKLLSFIESKDNIRKCISTMENNKSIGMCGNYLLIMDDSSDRDIPSMEGARLILKENFLYSGSIRFICGTMFIVRARIFEPIINMNINIGEFAESSINRKSSLAHMMERVFGAMVIYQGFTIEDCFTENKLYISYLERSVGLIVNLLFDVQRFIFQFKKTKNNNLIIKIMKIPVYVKKIK